MGCVCRGRGGHANIDATVFKNHHRHRYLRSQVRCVGEGGEGT